MIIRMVPDKVRIHPPVTGRKESEIRFRDSFGNLVKVYVSEDVMYELIKELAIEAERRGCQ